MLSPDLCRTLETAFQEKRLVRLEYDGLTLVAAVELYDLLTPASKDTCATIYICDPQTQYRDVVQSKIVDLSKVTHAELLEPYSEEVRRAIWPEVSGTWPVERRLKP